jgi:hypothetical protein
MIVTATDPMLAFAELLINTDYQRAELDRENLQLAREAQREAQAREVAALHAAADDVAIGAVVQGSVALAGAGCSAGAVLLDHGTTAKLVDAAGDGLNTLAGTLGKLTGEAPRMHDDARAKRAGYDAEQAGWRADDAREHAQRVADHSDRLLDAAATVMESEHAGKLAILANS